MTPISSVAKSHSLAVTGPIVTLLPDSPATYPEWKRLVIKHSVQGTKVHDTRLVAAMNAHGVGRIFTFNADDFRRYGFSIRL
jgi:predicted nucleic acid-binding protein